MTQSDSITAKHSLPRRVFLLILIFVTLSGIVIHIPSMASFCQSYLEHRILDAYIATLTLQADSSRRLEPALERKLLEQAKVVGIELPYDQAGIKVIIGQLPPPDTTFDLRTQTPYALLWESLPVLLSRGERWVRIIGYAPGETGLLMAVLISEKALYRELYTYSLQAIALSSLISLLTAVLLRFPIGSGTEANVLEKASGV